MTEIKFTEGERAAITRKIQLYFSEELKQQIGRFDAEFLLDFFAEEVGAYFYNRGVYEAQAIVASKLDDLGEAIYQLERPTDFKSDPPPHDVAALRSSISLLRAGTTCACQRYRRIRHQVASFRCVVQGFLQFQGVTEYFRSPAGQHP